MRPLTAFVCAGALLAVGVGPASAQAPGCPVGCGPAPVNYSYAPVTSYSVTSCYDPCPPRVGPVRRFLRRVFHPCCCPPAPVCAPRPVLVVPPPPVVLAPRPFLPPPTDGPVPAGIGRPLPPAMPPAPLPATEAPPPATGSSFRRPPPLTPPLPPPAVRVDRIASAPVGGNDLEGQVVGAENAPRAFAELTLVHLNRPGLSRTVTADIAGRFDVRLTPGAWQVYSRGSDGHTVLHGNVEVVPHQTCKVTVSGR